MILAKFNFNQTQLLSQKILLFSLYKSTTSFINQNPTPPKKRKTTTSKHQPWTEWEQPAFLEFYQETSLAACCTSTICGRRLISWKGPKLYGRDTCAHTLWWSKDTLARYNLGTTTWLFHHGSYWIQYSCKVMFGIFYGQQVLLVQNIWKSMAQLSHCIGLRMPELWRTSALSSTTSKLSWTY